MGESKGDFSIEKELQKAKTYLQQKSTKTNENLYDHLSEVLFKVLDERPLNVVATDKHPQMTIENSKGMKDVDVIENYINDAKQEKAKTNESFREVRDTAKEVALAEQQIKLFEQDGDGESGEAPVNENEEEFDIPLPNLMELAFYFEQAGTGLSREELYRIFLALKQLVFSYPLTSVRFWGKIFGIEANYIVAEVEFREGEEGEEENEKGRKKKKKDPKKGEDEEKEKNNEDDKKDEESEEDGVPGEEDEIPKPQWKPPPVIPKEDHHVGANKKVYFVCNEPGQTWVKLPHVLPAQIVAAREIRKLLTGKLDAPIISYPPFPGNESNYLRAQIARISAGTIISPAGFFIFEEEEEEEDEEGELRDSYVANVEFEGLSLRELTDPSMNNWVHHVQHILPQGRCAWYNPYQKPEEDFDDDELEEEEEEEGADVKPETGPQLLSAVSEDEPIIGLPAWTTYVSSRALPEHAVGVVRSNRWPGAYAFAKGRKFENVYIGYGNKYLSENYSPPAPPPALEEYPNGPEVLEMDDPTVEEEKALKQAQEEAMRAAEDMDDDDDDDDDD